MRRDIKESDWKIFRQLHAVALERFCERTLAEVNRVISERKGTFHEKYLKTWDLLRERDKQLARAMDNPRRSQALMQLAFMKRLGVVSEDELARFSPETRQAVQLLLGE